MGRYAPGSRIGAGAGFTTGLIKQRKTNYAGVVKCTYCQNEFYSLDRRKLRRCKACTNNIQARTFAPDSMLGG